MNLEFKNIESINTESISRIENLTEFKIPDHLINFWKKYAGGKSDWNSKQYLFQYQVSIGKKKFTQNSTIIGVLSETEIIEQWNYIETLQELKEGFELTDSYVETDKLLPFIDVTDGTIYIAVLGKHNGKIFLGDNGDFGIIEIANSLNDFLNILELKQ